MVHCRAKDAQGFAKTAYVIGVWVQGLACLGGPGTRSGSKKRQDKGRKEGSGSGAEESPKSSPKEKKKGSGLRGLRAFV